MIILSKTVRRECRGAMYGIFASSGSFGALLSLKIGGYLYYEKGPEYMYFACITLSLLTCVLILVSRIGTDPYFVKPKTLTLKTIECRVYTI